MRDLSSPKRNEILSSILNCELWRLKSKLKYIPDLFFLCFSEAGGIEEGRDRECLKVLS